MGQTVETILSAVGWTIEKTAEARDERRGELGNVPVHLPAEFEMRKEFATPDADEVNDRIWGEYDEHPMTLDLGEGYRPYIIIHCKVKPSGAQTKLVCVKVREENPTPATGRAQGPAPTGNGEGEEEPGRPPVAPTEEIDDEARKEADAMNEVSIDSPELGRAN